MCAAGCRSQGKSGRSRAAVEEHPFPFEPPVFKKAKGVPEPLKTDRLRTLAGKTQNSAHDEVTSATDLSIGLLSRYSLPAHKPNAVPSARQGWQVFMLWAARRLLRKLPVRAAQARKARASESTSDREAQTVSKAN